MILVVCATFDRFVAVWFPLKMKNWCNMRVAWAQIIIVMILIQPINFTTPIVRVLINGFCSASVCIKFDFRFLSKLIGKNTDI